MTPLVEPRKITLADGVLGSLDAAWQTEPILPRRKRPLLGYLVFFLSTRRERFPVLQGLLPNNRREPVARLLTTLPRPLRSPHQVPMSHAPTCRLRVPWIMEAVSSRGLFIPAEQDVLPKIQPFEEKSIEFSNTLGLSDCAITRPLPVVKTSRRRSHFTLTLSQEWVSCLCSRANLPGLSSGSINGISAPRLP